MNGSTLIIYGGISHGPPGDHNLLMITATIRNDYTMADAGNAPNTNVPVGNSNSLLASFANLTVRLYDQSGNLIQPDQEFGYIYPANQSVTLASGKTTSISFFLSPVEKYVDHYEIYASSLSGYP